MKKRYLPWTLIGLVLCGLLQATGAHSQTGTLSGELKDLRSKTGTAAASLQLLGTQWVTLSDLDGKFEFSDLPDGIYTLKISMAGYDELLLKDVSVAADSLTQLNIDYPPPCPGEGRGKRKGKCCPYCLKSNQVIPVIYGLPNSGLLRKEKEGKVFLGGCSVSQCAPDFYCKRDQKTFMKGKMEVISYSDLNNNTYRLRGFTLEYDPVKPMESSSGTYSGGEYKKRTISAEARKGIVDLVKTLIGSPELHTDQRRMLTSLLYLRNNGDELRFILPQSTDQNALEEALKNALAN